MQATTSNEERLLIGRNEAARRLGISPRKVWSMTAAGELAVVRIGRRVLYPVADLVRWIDETKKGGCQ